MDKRLEEILMEKDFPEFHVTEETKEDVNLHPERYLGCDARIRMGLFRTEREQEEYIKQSVVRPLPGDDEPKNGFARIRSK
ncbi:MAG: hypothetical protein IJN03_02440 [Bacilli bacterium]|nr:hypothetical protein [Bacilli bacterium]